MESPGAYLLLRPLGQGAAGRVYEAQDTRSGARVAVKVLREDASPLLRARLRKEAQLLMRLQHRYLVRFVALLELPGGGLALVQELLHGVSLRQRLLSGALPVPLLLRLGGQVASALAYAHAQGVVHRDVKPDNIMLVPTPDGEEARLLDLGVARAEAPLASDAPDAVHTLPQTGDGILGTLGYLAPEQLHPARQGGRPADVFSLGVVLYEGLTGELPCAGDAAGLLRPDALPDPPSRRCGAVPVWLDRLVLSMLAHDPEKRPSMARIAEALTPLPAERCPFPGLSAFSEAEEEVFCGRDQEVQDASALLGPGAGTYRRWLQLEGASGCGKSSLLLAGLLPRWRRQGLGVRGETVVVALRPGREPLLNLAQALRERWPQLGTLAAVLGRLEGPAGLRHLLRERCRPEDAVLLALDQLEEALLSEGPAVAQLDTLLDGALGDGDGPLHLLTTLRSDLLGQLRAMPLLERRLNGAARYHLSPMDEAGLREAILGPCARAGLSVEPELLGRLVLDSAGLGGSLTLLGHALQRLYLSRRGRLLTLAAYQDLGGVAGALGRETDALLDGLGGEGRERARRLLLSLVRMGRGQADTRCPRSRAEALTAAGGDALAERVLQRCSGARDEAAPQGAPPQVRLLVASDDRVELIHEALLLYMPALRCWLEEGRRLLLRRDDLERAAETWADMGHPEDGLPQGAALGYYAGEELRALASPAAQAYLARARRRERRRRFFRGGVAAAALLAVPIFLLLGAAREQRARLRQLELLAGEAELDFVRDHMEPADAASFYQKQLERVPEGGFGEAALSGRHIRAQLLRRLGDLDQEQEQKDAALRRYQEVLRLLDQRGDEKSLVYRAEVTWRIAELAWEMGQRPAAQEAIRTAEALLLRADPAQENLAFVGYIQGRFALDAQDHDQDQADLAQVLAVNQRAIDRQRQLAKEDPAYPGYRWHLGRLLLQEAQIRAARGESPAARAAHDQGIRHLREALAADPRHRRYQKDLRDAEARDQR